jgi:hypothetical protein
MESSYVFVEVDRKEIQIPGTGTDGFGIVL